MSIVICRTASHKNAATIGAHHITKAAAPQPTHVRHVVHSAVSSLQLVDLPRDTQPHELPDLRKKSRKFAATLHATCRSATGPARRDFQLQRMRSRHVSRPPLTHVTAPVSSK
ncbi:hypothetical protein Sjap_019884 [Stephania japonica]|uniref:Uncharacterized protein n=1 Tax=Stephania japonica TaxID=461633 RepID=A0AAP0HZY4_9MAGN